MAEEDAEDLILIIKNKFVGKLYLFVKHTGMSHSQILDSAFSSAEKSEIFS